MANGIRGYATFPLTNAAWYVRGYCTATRAYIRNMHAREDGLYNIYIIIIAADDLLPHFVSDTPFARRRRRRHRGSSARVS